VVRGTFSPARAWRPAVGARLARTLGHAKQAFLVLSAASNSQLRTANANATARSHRTNTKTVPPLRQRLHGRRRRLNPRDSASAREDSHVNSPCASHQRQNTWCRHVACEQSAGGRRQAVATAPAVSPLHPVQRGLTPRSSRAPTACHAGPAGGTRYIFASRARASRRRCRLNSNVRPHNRLSMRRHYQIDLPIAPYASAPALVPVFVTSPKKHRHHVERFGRYFLREMGAGGIMFEVSEEATSIDFKPYKAFLLHSQDRFVGAACLRYRKDQSEDKPWLFQ
jgi:hypothetical protein